MTFHETDTFITNPSTGFQEMRDKYIISNLIVAVADVSISPDSALKIATVIYADLQGDNIDFAKNPGILEGKGNGFIQLTCSFETAGRADVVGPFKFLLMRQPEYSWSCERNAVENLLPVGNVWDLPMLPDKQEEMKRLVEGFNGSASSIDGNYWRMLYLSVVVITTLGLGDMVPISSLSRLLVAIESVLGLTMIGLFLNAISWQASHPEPPTEGREAPNSDCDTGPA